MAKYQQEQALGIERAQTASTVSANSNMDMEASRGKKNKLIAKMKILKGNLSFFLI